MPFEALPDTGVVTDTLGSVPTPTPPPITQTPQPQQQAVNPQPDQQAVQQPIQQQAAQTQAQPGSTTTDTGTTTTSTDSNGTNATSGTTANVSSTIPRVPQFQMPQFQYNPQYQQLTNAATSQYLQRLNSGFQYDPSQDQSLQQAGKEMERQTLETMNQRGILNSSMTGDSVAAGWANLMPQYYQIAYGQVQRRIVEVTRTLQISPCNSTKPITTGCLTNGKPTRNPLRSNTSNT